MLKMKEIVTILKTQWCIDTSASSHMTYSKSFFLSFEENFRGTVTVANGEKVEYIGRGDVRMNVFVGNKSFSVDLTDVLLVPCIDSNLSSVSKLCNKGYNTIFDSTGCYLKVEGVEPLQIAEKSGDMYVVRAEVERSCLVNDRVDRCCVHEWHRKLAHRNLHDILTMKDKMFRTDRGTEYLSEEVQKYLRLEGIRFQCCNVA